ncbi:hypothetical protein FSARC_13697 [Fusarium sarcochroum]|uniref:VOC domain-containing protein n=1 Tax=Fusarium sarcochroum TaxID=1208366 RepID=A0A8H4SZD1_9HYPO|nr:hypothetical protein FSARC_13697 [Fusarium sarcochroum]
MSRTPPRYNRPFNHIGVSVSDAKATVDWYSRVMGFQLLGDIYHIKRSEHPNDAIFRIYPDSLQEVKLARMATGNGVGFEIFEFINPRFKAAKEFEYERAGVFHICVTDVDPEGLVKKVEAEGGKKIGETVDPSGKGEIVCLYLSDPWNNVIEVIDVGFEVMGFNHAAAYKASPYEQAQGQDGMHHLIRRVKCDELRPACHRCTSTGRKCDGYASTSTAVAGPVAPPRLGGLALKEARAQEFFYHETVPQVSGFFGRPFWNIVLQFSLTEASIRHASVALAALHEEHSTISQTSQKDSLKIAFQSYNRAINTILKLASDPASIPLVIISSIVFTCFECLLGDPKSAASHVTSGLKLLKMLRERTGQPSGPWGQRYQNFESAFVETHLAPVLCTLSLCVTEFGYPAELYLNMVDANGCPVFDRPFQRLLEARVGIIDIITAATRISQDGTPNSQPDKSRHLQAALGRWKTRFDDLVLQRESFWDPQDHSAANLIRVMSQATAVGLLVGPAADETAWDTHKATYEEIIRLVESLIDNAQGSQRFHFEMGLISPLHLVAWKCRWPSLRRTGLALLRASSRRECLYDARLYYAVFSRIMAIEEADFNQPLDGQCAQHDLPPENARIHHFICETLPLGKYGVYLLKLFSRPKWPDPEWRLHTEHIYLDAFSTCQGGDSLPSSSKIAKLPVVNLFRTGPVPTIA